MKVTNYTEPVDDDDDEVIASHIESTAHSMWPCAVIMLICALVVLGVCFAGVYLLINWPQS